MESKSMNMLDAFVKYLGAFMALIYVAAGLFLLLQSDKFAGTLPPHYFLVLGGMLVVYGAFRGYRVYKKYFEPQHENDD